MRSKTTLKRPQLIAQAAFVLAVSALSAVIGGEHDIAIEQKEKLRGTAEDPCAGLTTL